MKYAALQNRWFNFPLLIFDNLSINATGKLKSENKDLKKNCKMLLAKDSKPSTSLEPKSPLIIQMLIILLEHWQTYVGVYSKKGLLYKVVDTEEHCQPGDFFYHDSCCTVKLIIFFCHFKLN